MTFYHASNIGNLSEILPLSTLRGVEEKISYFTPHKAYALFYLRDMEINHVTCGVSENGITKYHEQFQNQLETIYKSRSGYIYSCENDDGQIQEHTSSIWISKTSIKKMEQEYIADVYAEILNAEARGEVQIIRYESLSDEKKQEIIVMMENYIIKHGFLNSSSPKAEFMKMNFPQSWINAVKANKKGNTHT